MTKFIFANNAGSQLAAPITSGATSLTLAAGTGTKFPSPASGQQASLTVTDAGTGALIEIMYYTTRTGDVFTGLLRGQEGTTARAYSIYDPVANLFTAGQAAVLAQNPSDNIGGFSAVQTYAGNPNGHVSGNAAASPATAPSLVWDTTDQIFWVCTSTGTTSTAVWTATNATTGTTFCGTSTGSANAQILTPAVPLTSYVTGQAVSFIAGFTNNNALQVNVSGIGLVNVYKESPTGAIPLTGGEVVATNLLSMRFDGTRYQLTATELGTAALANASSNTGVVAAATGSFTVGHLAIFSDTQGTVKDGGVPGASAAPVYINFGNANNIELGSGVYNADTSTAAGGSFTPKLAASPNDGDSVQFYDPYGTWPDNNLALNPNGKTIELSTTNLNCGAPGVSSVTLIYKSSTNNWSVQP